MCEHGCKHCYIKQDLTLRMKSQGSAFPGASRSIPHVPELERSISRAKICSCAEEPNARGGCKRNKMSQKADRPTDRKTWSGLKVDTKRRIPWLELSWALNRPFKLDMAVFGRQNRMGGSSSSSSSSQTLYLGLFF